MKLIYNLLPFFLVSNLIGQVKIKCDDVKLASKPLPEVSYVKAIEKRIDGQFEACQIELRKELFVETEFHPFVSTLYMAYSDHRPVSISPDMIWLLVCQGFSTHVNLNTEELRNKFVSFNDKKKLVVNTQFISDKFKKGSINSPWELAFPAMADSISKNVKKDIHSLFVQSFSTTTKTEKATYEVALLDVMSGYFEYEFATACGIPEINIEGTKQDWEKIKNNLNNLKGYGIDNWINSLEPIIQKFIDVSENKIDKTFWENIFKRKDESGGPYITGWIIKFFPYINDGSQKMILNPYINKEPKEFMEGLETNQFNNGLSRASFTWNYFGKIYEMEFLAGFVCIKQDKKTLTLRPEIGWLVKDKYDSKKKVEINKLGKNKNTKTIESFKDYRKYILPLIFIILIGVFIVYKIKKNQNK